MGVSSKRFPRRVIRRKAAAPLSFAYTTGAVSRHRHAAASIAFRTEATLRLQSGSQTSGWRTRGHDCTTCKVLQTPLRARASNPPRVARAPTQTYSRAAPDSCPPTRSASCGRAAVRRWNGALRCSEGHVASRHHPRRLTEPASGSSSAADPRLVGINDASGTLVAACMRRWALA